MSYQNQDLNGKVVVISGATSGIGRATAIAMVEQGAFVVLNSRDENSLKGLVAELKDGSSAYVAGDCSDPEVCKKIAAVALNKFSTIDIVIPNAGVGLYLSLIHISEPTRPY